MKIDDLLDSIKPPETPAEFRQLVSLILEAVDVTESEKGAFQAGYVAGLSYALVSGPTDGATELILRLHEVNDAKT